MKRHSVAAVLIALIIMSVSMYAAAEPSEVNINVTPSTLILGDQGEWVTVHTDIPYTSVDTTADVILDGVVAAYLCVDSNGNLVGKFDQGIFKDKYGDEDTPVVVPLTFTGTYADGSTFAGEDTITVRDQGKNK